MIFLVCLPSLAATTQASPSPDGSDRDSKWLHEQWTAQWIGPAGDAGKGYGVYLFRKTIDLAESPKHFVVHVSADARYRLYVNGSSVAFGPQQSDAQVWRYDTLDLAPWLQTGPNVIAAQVWSYGEYTPCAIVSQQTGLILQGDTEAEASVDTDASWKVTRDDAYSPLPVHLPAYIVVGPGEHVDGTKHLWDWTSVSFNDHAWSAPILMGRGKPCAWGTDIARGLAPRTIPPMEESPIRFATVRRSTGVTAPANFVSGGDPIVIPAHTQASVLLDQGFETNAFPQLTVSGGKGASMKLTYAEALIGPDGKKNNRNDIADRHIEGKFDQFITDGGSRRRFTTLDFRTYRYVQLDATTVDEPLRIDDMCGVFTGYPFRERGSFTSDDPELAEIWATGWRTARLCAFETYMDCPYYEQLQYVGDTRIQALISMYVSGDDRLMRNAIDLYDRSRLAEGLTQSRYPSVTPQVINTFSLFWIEMVHDYWMHRIDGDFVRKQLPGIQAVIGWFERRIDARTGLLGPLAYWSFVDWTKEWAWDDDTGTGGEPEGARTGGSAIISLQFAQTLMDAADLFRAMGDPGTASHYEQVADGLRQATMRQCWDAQRRMLADTPAKKAFSQHANALAVLSGAVNGDEATDLMRRVEADGSLIQCSTYFRFYLLRAMKKAGLGDCYLDCLEPWETMLKQGLTTFAEQPDPTRSDCHAWSASPVYELLATVCGIEPAAPGFSRVRISPHPGQLHHFEGVVTHPAGEIRIQMTRTGTHGIEGIVMLPDNIEGEFEWAGKVVPLHGGTQRIHLP